MLRAFPGQHRIVVLHAELVGKVPQVLQGAGPLAEHFPARNRLISGLADQVIVVEAREKSGTMSTVHRAQEYGRPVYAVPGNIFSPLSQGTNQLIAQGQAQVLRSAEGLLEDLGLSERMSHKPSELSGGEQQRVAIARALVNSPAVLYADEPSGNLDSHTKAELHGLFFSLRDRYGQTIVIDTHDPELASMCDRTLVMKDGLFVPASDGRGTGEQEPAGEEE